MLKLDIVFKALQWDTSRKWSQAWTSTCLKTLLVNQSRCLLFYAPYILFYFVDHLSKTKILKGKLPFQISPVQVKENWIFSR